MTILRGIGWLVAFGSGAVAAWAALTSEEERLAAWVDAHAAEFALDLEAAVRIDSSTENLAGVRQLGERFARQFTELGFDARFVPLPETGRAGHLVATRRGSRGKRLLLIGHLDTVFPGGTFRRDGDVAHGAGVADMKGGDVVVVHALRALASIGALEGVQIRVVFTGDEEAVGQPHELARRDLVTAAEESDLALAFESAIGDTATVARRGSISWSLEVQGATGHSSGIFSAAMGDGAIYEMARILTGFREEVRAFDGATLSPGLVTAGTAAELERTGGTATGKTNVVAQRALVRGDLRTVSAQQLADVQARMQAVVAKHLPRTSATLTFAEGYAAMSPTPGNYALLEQLDAVSRDLGYGRITAFDPRGRGAGDISFVSPPLPALDGLGLDGPGQHTPQESTDLRRAPELVKRAAVLIYRLTR